MGIGLQFLQPVMLHGPSNIFFSSDGDDSYIRTYQEDLKAILKTSLTCENSIIWNSVGQGCSGKTFNQITGLTIYIA
ncbi:hypothetical protein CS542_10315 [Pedobacter sp. IW39]|nr:hypothetical protein CS542_10315 [Pedobacter sp. IW39]